MENEEKLHDLDKETSKLIIEIGYLKREQQELKEDQREIRSEFRTALDESKGDDRFEKTQKLSKLAILLTAIGLFISVGLAIIGFFVK